MKVDSYKCNCCGGMKGSLNHWFEIPPMVPSSLTIRPWPTHPEAEYLHYCSDACVIKAVQQWLSAQKEASQKSGEENNELYQSAKAE